LAIGFNLSVFPTEYDAGHLPRLTNFDSVLDLFTFCNLVFLFNVLDFRTYQNAPKSTVAYRDKYDLNAIPSIERYQMTHARGFCLDILLWFFTEYEIYDRGTNLTIDGFKEVAMGYLSHQASVILAYKKKAFQQKMAKDGFDFHVCTVQYLETQINLCIQNHKEIPAIKNLPIDGDEQLTLSFPNKDRYGVRKLEESRPHPSLCKYPPLS
jgi:hypothetical protein